jgi:hypothetical protein
MEESLEFRWYKVRNKVKEQFGQRPDVNAMLFLIGMNEIGIVKEEWSKEEKQDLMHVAVCKLLSSEGYYKFVKVDSEGWHHYEQNNAMPVFNLKTQEELLKQKIIEYFEAL